MSRPIRLIRTFASTSTLTAAAPSGRPAPAPVDSKTDSLRYILYPTDSHSPRSASPTGAYHPQVIERVHHILQSPEVHETIERAFHHYKRTTRAARLKSLQAKYDAMVHACEELDRLTKSVEGGGEGLWEREVYEKAVRGADPYKGEQITGRSSTPLSRWKEGRLDGLIPRESWVPVESRGKGWNYGWRRPEDKS